MVQMADSIFYKNLKVKRKILPIVIFKKNHYLSHFFNAVGRELFDYDFVKIYADREKFNYGAIKESFFLEKYQYAYDQTKEITINTDDLYNTNLNPIGEEIQVKIIQIKITETKVPVD